jgi:hypothetical protein
VERFSHILFFRVPRSSNGEADALARIAKELAEPNGEEILIEVRKRRCLTSCLTIPNRGHSGENRRDEANVCAVQDKEDWRVPFL